MGTRVHHCQLVITRKVLYSVLNIFSISICQWEIQTYLDMSFLPQGTEEMDIIPKRTDAIYQKLDPFLT
jgi:hypothetical protein